MTLIKQCDDTFVRVYDNEIGFIVKQPIRASRVFEGMGVVYLGGLSRSAWTFDQMARRAMTLRPAVAPAVILRDLSNFISLLSANGFVATGRNAAELRKREVALTSDIKSRIAADPSSVWRQGAADAGSSTALTDYFRERPRIFGGQVDLASRCNQTCRHCYLTFGKHSVLLDTHLALDVLDQYAEQGALPITFSGGEPFLHPEIGKILRHARKNDFVIVAQSNGVLIGEKQVELLKEIRLNQIQISLFSMNARHHEAITQTPGSHAKTLRAIEMLLDAGFRLRIACHIMRQNRASYRSVIEWGQKQKIPVFTDYLTIPSVDLSRSNLKDCLTREQTERVMKEHLSYGPDYGARPPDHEFTANPRKFRGERVCNVGSDSLCTAANGDYYPCSGFIGYKLGNAARDRMADVWRNSSALMELRSLTWRQFPKCRKCKALAFCSMCVARNFNDNAGNIYKTSGDCCWTAFLNKRITEERWNSMEG